MALSVERRIYKYDLPMIGTHVIAMPRGAKILSVQDQSGAMRVWAKVDPKAPMENRRFVIVGTGHLVPAALTYLATVQQGQYVWHVFVENEEYL
jgi:hypothetical protein